MQSVGSSYESNWSQEGDRLRWIREGAMRIPDLGIVISGMSGRFPNADSINELELNLRQGNDLVTYNDSSRFPVGQIGTPTSYGRIKDLTKFDQEFFAPTTKSPAGKVADIELGHLLEVVYETILDAGLNPSQLRGSRRVGVFSTFRLAEFKRPYMTDSVSNSLDSNPSSFNLSFGQCLAQYFDFRGQVVDIEGACAASGACLSEAIRAIEFGCIDRAIVVGLNLPIDPRGILPFLLFGTLSPTSQSRPLDARTDGYTKAEVIASLMIERKHLARRCYATIVQTWMGCDGFKREGITYPSGEAQSDLVGHVKKLSGIHRNHVQYFELHGTGTSTGDPIEMESSMRVYNPVEQDPRDRRTIGPVLIGTSKSSIGHSEAASAICSIVNVCLMMENELIYKTVNFEHINPKAQSVVDGRAKVVSELTKLEAKIVPVSNYGFGGLGAHFVLKANNKPAIETAKSSKNEPVDPKPRIVVMFGRGESELEYFFDKLISNEGNYQTRNCLSDDFLFLVDSVNSCQIDRFMNYRGYAIVDVNNRIILAKHIGKCELKPPPQTHMNHLGNQQHYQSARKRHCAMLFPGLGYEWCQKASGLQGYAPFWSTIERLHKILVDSKTSMNLIELINEEEEIKLTPYAPNCVVMVAYIISQINIFRDQLKLRDGVESLKFAGHSMGECLSFYARNLIDERQTMLFGYAIGIAYQENAERIAGKLIALMMNAAEAQAMIEQSLKPSSSVRVACINGPLSVTVSGTHQDIEEFMVHLESSGQIFKVINQRFALHNEVTMTQEVKDNFKRTFDSIVGDAREIKCNPLHSPEWLPCIRSLSQSQADEMTISEYLAELMCRQVDFLDVCQQFDPETIVIDFGSIGLFESQIKLLSTNERPLHYVKLMQRNTPKERQVTRTLEAIGKLYSVGATLDFVNFNSNHSVNWNCNNNKLRRQTPSMSSLIKWKRNKSFALPTFDHLSSSNQGLANLSINITEYVDERKYLLDHKIDNRCLFPAAGYLFLAWKAFSSITSGKTFGGQMNDCCRDADLVPVEFIKFEIYQAIMLSEDQLTQEPANDHSKVELNFAYDICTGKFEFLDANKQVICNGSMRSPREKQNKLLNENLRYGQVSDKLANNVLTHEDVYRQLRVRGYDYGKSFRLIEQAELPTKERLKINYANHFICFADNLLQAYITSCCDRSALNLADPFDLFVPTRIEYVRILPNILSAKLGLCNLSIDTKSSDVNVNVEINDNQQTQTCCDGVDQKICQFEVSANAQVGVVVTDGLEIKGLKVASVKRNLKEPKLECESFIRDVELPIEDELILSDKLIQENEDYLDTCNMIANEIIEGNYNDSFSINIDGLYQSEKISNPKQIEQTLLSALLAIGNKKQHSELKMDIVNDIDCDAAILRRICGPILESIIENLRTTKTSDSAITMAEIQSEYNSPSTTKIVEFLSTYDLGKLNFDYTVFHSESMVDKQEIKSSDLVKRNKLQDLAKVTSTFDCIIYKVPHGGFSLSAPDQKMNMSMLNDRVGPGCFIVVVLRKHLSLAERLVHVEKELKDRGQNMKDVSRGDLLDKIDSINTKAKEWCDSVELEAKKLHMSTIASKSDHLGNLVLVYKTTNNQQKTHLQDKSTSSCKSDVNCCIIMRIDHVNVECWLNEIRSNMNEANDSRKVIWLCAIATKQCKINGLIGLMRTLIKEYGSEHLRCFYDNFTFKDKMEPVGLDDIKNCLRFRQSMVRDVLWNCFDSNGNSGCYRHQIVNEYLSYGNSRTDCQAIEYESLNPNNKTVSGCYVNVSSHGDLSSFKWYESPLKYLHKHERDHLVSVCYSALNFRDVMLATGKIQTDLFTTTHREDTLLGLEYCGIEMATGKRVMGSIVGASIATHVTATPDRALQFEVPEWMDMKDAATLPVVYSTVIMGLIVRGKVKRGESILIHAGSGGIGQAAINLCGHYGLTIYTTVGTQDKRDFLKSEFPDFIEDSRMFSSRDCNFEHQIMAATKGRGVDLVLNSLADEKLQASIRCLADGGRFIEIGKYDLALDSKIELLFLDTNKTYHGVCFEKVFSNRDSSRFFEAQTLELREIFNTLLNKRWIKSLKYTVFKRNQVEEAFRFMAKGKHIGKVLLEINEPEMISAGKSPKLTAEPRMHFSKDKSYIVTGGLGGMGMELCKWLACNGVRHLIITSRYGCKIQYQTSTLKMIKNTYNCDSFIVTHTIADTESWDGCEKLCQMATDFAPSRQIGGIFHLSAVLKDGLFDSLCVEDFTKVFKPKLDTAIYLDAALGKMQLNLDYFVCFSSITSGRGNIGQTNYAYANSALERICEQRRSRRQHGVAIQWGIIGDVGLAYDLNADRDSTGMNLMHQRIASCFKVLPKLVCSPFAITASCMHDDRIIIDKSSGADSKDFMSVILNILGLKPESLASEQITLGDLGLDSLMAVEIRQQIERHTGKNMTVQDIRSFKVADLNSLSASTR